MSHGVSISLRAEQDITHQYRWYLENGDAGVAEQYLLAVHKTIHHLVDWPASGVRRRFKAPELANIRSILVRKPFDCHLLFYMETGEIRVERVLHGARDIPKRLLDEP